VAKENERRLLVYPSHVEWIEPELRRRIHLEYDHGERFGVSDVQLAPLVAGLCSRAQLVEDCDDRFQGGCS
jgi:hypothetical protein